MIGQDFVVQPDAVLGPVDSVQFLFGVHSRGFLVPCVRADLAQIFALDSLQQHVFALILRENQVFEDFEDVVADRVLQDGPGKFYDHLADKSPRYVLHKKVVGVAARKVDVEAERQRAWHKHLVRIQLRHVDLRLAGAGLRFVKGYSFDGARGLKGIQSFNYVRGSERVGHLSDFHRFSIDIYIFNLKNA